MTTTTNLGLSTYDTASGSATTFLTYRLAQSGLSSNMTKIDSFAGETSASIASARTGTIFDVNAMEISSNYYEGSNGGIGSYATNLKINLKTNTSISGSASLNINALGIKSLMKVDSTSGSLTNLVAGDITLNKYSQFIYNGTYFVSMNGVISSGSSTSGSGTTYSGSAPIVVSGSVISHSVSGVTSGSYNQFRVNSFGHITEGSFVGTGTAYSGSAPITIAGSVISHATSGVTSGSYNQFRVNSFGHITEGSYVAGGGISSVSGSGIMSTTTGSIVKHNTSAVSPGNYLAANITVDSYGHLTAVESGVSASSVGAPSDTPFITSASTPNLTNYGILTAGSNVTITSASANGGKIYINSTGGGGSSDGWTAAGETWTYNSADAPSFIFDVNADVTAKYSPGMKIKLDQTTTKYFIITAVGAYGASTPITVYGGTDYTLVSAAITNPYWSMFRSPFGFPMNMAKWTVEVTDTTNRNQDSPTQNTWYNLGSMGITIPIGVWKLEYNVSMFSQRTNAVSNIYTTLSTANNSESDADLTSFLQVEGTVSNIASTIFRQKSLVTASKTPYYLNAKTDQTAVTSIYFLNGLSKMILRASCQYV